MSAVVDMIEKLLVQNVSQIFGLLALGVSIVLLNKTKTWWEKRKESVVESSINHNADVRRLITELRAIYDADRVKLFQFHNGTYYISGEDNMKCSLTHFTMKTGVSYPVDVATTHQNVPISYFSYTLKSLKESKDGVVGFNVEDMHEDSYFKYLFTTNGTRRVVITPVNDVEGRWIGFIIMSWLSTEHTKQDITQFKEYAQSIGALMSLNRKKKK